MGLLDMVQTRKWRWMVQGYNVRGEKLTGTKHTSDISKDVEVSAWQSRMDKPSSGVSHIEITDLVNGGTKTLHAGSHRRSEAQKNRKVGKQ